LITLLFEVVKRLTKIKIKMSPFWHYHGSSVPPVGIPENRLIREALREWLERKLLLIESEIREILICYEVTDMVELKKKIKKGDVEGHPTWEDLITLENLINEKKKLKEALRVVEASERYTLR